MPTRLIHGLPDMMTRRVSSIGRGRIAALSLLSRTMDWLRDLRPL